MPDVDHVAWQPAGHQEDGIDSNIVPLAGVARRQPLGGHRDATQAILVERHGSRLFVCPRLDLDECDCPSAPRDEIDFSAGHAGTAGEDAPAVQAQPPGGDGLCLAAPLLRNDPPIQRPSSRARA